MPGMKAHWAMHARRALTAIAAASLAACASWLPKAHTVTVVRWNSFDEAKAAIDKIMPYESRRADLTAQGIDPLLNPAVTILNYSDVAQRFATGAIVGTDQVDRGIRECLVAGKSCTGYQIEARRTNRNRVGNFWLDSFTFVRETEVSGWSFRSTILFVDDLAVYTTYGGQPLIHEQEVDRKPMGPLQTGSRFDDSNQ
jgi:hypothetical protein